MSKASAAFRALLATPKPALTKQSVTLRCAEGASRVVRPWLQAWQGLRLPLAEKKPAEHLQYGISASMGVRKC
jgi:hypothetical protein